jgi:hypothetical protein
MDPEYVDEEEEAAAMAAMMGFSGFGSQKPPAKRRKFTTDAFIDGQEPVDRGGKKGQGSGGNTMPLGKTRVFGTGSTEKAMEPAGMNDSEIDLGDDDEADGPQYVDTSLPPPVLPMHSEGPQYIDTSEPPPGAALEEEAREMQSRIDVSNPLNGKDKRSSGVYRQFWPLLTLKNPPSLSHRVPIKPIAFLKDRFSILRPC